MAKNKDNERWEKLPGQYMWCAPILQAHFLTSH